MSAIVLSGIFDKWFQNELAGISDNCVSQMLRTFFGGPWNEPSTNWGQYSEALYSKGLRNIPQTRPAAFE